LPSLPKPPAVFEIVGIITELEPIAKMEKEWGDISARTWESM